MIFHSYVSLPEGTCILQCSSQKWSDLRWRCRRLMLHVATDVRSTYHILSLEYRHSSLWFHVFMHVYVYIYMYTPYLIVQVLFTFMISLSQSYFYQSIIQYNYIYIYVSIYIILSIYIYISIYIIDLCRYVYYRRKWRCDVEHVEPPDTPSTREAVARGAASAGFLGWKNAMGWRLNWISASYVYLYIYIRV